VDSYVQRNVGQEKNGKGGLIDVRNRSVAEKSCKPIETWKNRA
jgi:hypothetical protein